jgi:hypothetical protein
MRAGMTDLVDIERYRKELDAIENEFQRLNGRRDALRQFLAAYAALQEEPAVGGQTGQQKSRSSASLSPTTFSATAAASGGRPDSARKQILQAVIDVLKDGRPHRTADLLAELTRRQVDVGGKDRQQTIARILSGNPLFTPDRKLGWSLTSSKK